MKSLYLRIYLTLVALLLAFAFGSAFLFHRQIEQERGSFDAAASERTTSLAALIHGALPGAEAPREQQAQALREWGQRLRMAIALYDSQGQRIAASELFERRENEVGARSVQVPLDDGRSLWLLRGLRPMMGPTGPEGLGGSGGDGRLLDPGGPGRQSGPPGDPGGPGAMPRDPGGPGGPGGFGANGDDFRRLRGPRTDDSIGLFSFLPPLPSGEVLLVLLLLLFLAVAISAYPVVRRLTRRLENLQRGVEQFGAGNLKHRVEDNGRDEVAALAGSFNRAATQIEALLRSHQSLLANASHELRSPLARLKMAFAMLEGSTPAHHAKLQREIDTNIAELDALVEEVLLASRLESGSQELARDPVDLLGMAAEEASRTGALVDVADGAQDFRAMGEDRLLRRAMRNLLENARRYGRAEQEPVLLRLSQGGGRIEVRVCDRGPGVPADMRERIFEPFFRLPGHAEQAGGVGLGLSLVKQIAERHRGTVRCEAREGGGSCFVLNVPAA